MKVLTLSATQPTEVTVPSYRSLCQQYAPALWGLILLANLPISHSEPILVNTLANAWQKRDEQPVGGPHYLSWLLGLAHAKGLPYERVQAILSTALCKSNQVG